MFIQQAFLFNEVTCIKTTQQCLPAQQNCQSLALRLPPDLELVSAPAVLLLSKGYTNFWTHSKALALSNLVI